MTSLLECYEWFGEGFRIRTRHTISPCSDHLPWSSPKPLWNAPVWQLQTPARCDGRLPSSQKLLWSCSEFDDLGTSGMVEGSHNDLGRWSILINIIDDKIPYDRVSLFHFCSACVFQVINNDWCFETWGIVSVWKAFVLGLLGDLFAILYFLGASTKNAPWIFKAPEWDGKILSSPKLAGQICDIILSVLW